MRETLVVLVSRLAFLSSLETDSSSFRMHCRLLTWRYCRKAYCSRLLCESGSHISSFLSHSLLREARHSLRLIPPPHPHTSRNFGKLFAGFSVLGEAQQADRNARCLRARSQCLLRSALVPPPVHSALNNLHLRKFKSPSSSFPFASSNSTRTPPRRPLHSAPAGGFDSISHDPKLTTLSLPDLVKSSKRNSTPSHRTSSSNPHRHPIKDVRHHQHPHPPLSRSMERVDLDFPHFAERGN